MVTRVKICGLTNAADAELAIELGADALGFVLEPSSPRYVGEKELPWISVLPPFPIKIAVFGRVDRPVHRSLYDVIQGVEWDVFPEATPKRIVVVRPRPNQKPEDIVNHMVHASAVLLDAYKEDAYGGTGHKVDWDLAAEIVRLARMPVILAGGLNPDNVADAVRKVRPYAVDVSSGVEERPGIKDAKKLKDFIEAAKQA